eukprot:4559675-Amphidinium_carterae.1
MSGVSHPTAQKWLMSDSDGTSWSLYLEDEAGQKYPQSDACLDCHEMWVKCFSYMSWDETCTKASESTEFLALVGKARSVKHGHATIDALPTSVSSSRKIMLQVERSMIVVSEKELRKEGNLNRISKSTLKNIPSLT